MALAREAVSKECQRYLHQLKEWEDTYTPTTPGKESDYHVKLLASDKIASESTQLI